MATSEQIKSLIRAHFEGDNEKYKTIVLQIAAYEAKLGHTKLARELKIIIDKGTSSKNKVLQLNTQNALFLRSFPTERLSEMVVSDDLHNRIKRILDEYQNRNKLKRYGLINRRKILLEGVPGTGKTMTASVIASHLNLPLNLIQMDKLVTKFMGETSVKLRQVFDSMEDDVGVYFFDEFDAIGADRGLDNEVGEMRRILNSFLQFIEMDESDSIIIAATNNQKILDQALFRRFDDVIHYTMPTDDEIKRLFQVKLGGFYPGFIVSYEVKEKSHSLSHAEISRVCDDAIKTAILNDTTLTNELLLQIIYERLSVYKNKEAN